MGRIFYKDFKTLIKENISKSNTSVKNMFVPALGASRPYFVIAQRSAQLSSEKTSQNKTTELTGICQAYSASTVKQLKLTKTR